MGMFNTSSHDTRSQVCRILHIYHVHVCCWRSLPFLWCLTFNYPHGGVLVTAPIFTFPRLLMHAGQALDG
ncbi:hypothetical protein M404DRAFT_998959, partial [Pisolithus tinctorius Marx 270]